MTTRRKPEITRRKTQNARRSGPKRVASQKPSALASELSRRDALVRAGQYQILGRVVHIRTIDGKVMHFGTASPKTKADLSAMGPTIARLTADDNDSIVILDPWRGLPARPDMETMQPCPDCKLDTCTACAGSGRVLCTAPGCGGLGKVIVLGKPEEEWLTCQACKNENAVEQRIAHPPKRKGGKSKVEVVRRTTVECPQCKASGRMSTGMVQCKEVGGPDPTPARAVLKDGNPCPTCHGTAVVMEMKSQPLESFVHGQLEGMIALGPIASIPFAPISAGDRVGVIQPMQDMDGNYMVMLLGNNGRAWFYGGIPRIAMANS